MQSELSFEQCKVATSVVAVACPLLTLTYRFLRISLVVSTYSLQRETQIALELSFVRDIKDFPITLPVFCDWSETTIARATRRDLFSDTMCLFILLPKSDWNYARGIIYYNLSNHTKYIPFYHSFHFFLTWKIYNIYVKLLYCTNIYKKYYIADINNILHIKKTYCFIHYLHGVTNKTLMSS